MLSVCEHFAAGTILNCISLLPNPGLGELFFLPLKCNLKKQGGGGKLELHIASWLQLALPYTPVPTSRQAGIGAHQALTWLKDPGESRLACPAPYFWERRQDLNRHLRQLAVGKT